MRMGILILSVLVTISSASTAQAQLFWKGGIEIKHGMFGTSRIRAPAGTNICQGPCGLKMSGPYCSPCGPMQGGCGGGYSGCGTNMSGCNPCGQGSSCGPPMSQAYVSAPCGQGASAVIVPQPNPAMMRYSAPVFYAPSSVRGGY